MLSKKLVNCKNSLHSTFLLFYISTNIQTVQNSSIRSAHSVPAKLGIFIKQGSCVQTVNPAALDGQAVSVNKSCVCRASRFVSDTLAPGDACRACTEGDRPQEADDVKNTQKTLK